MVDGSSTQDIAAGTMATDAYRLEAQFPLPDMSLTVGEAFRIRPHLYDGGTTVTLGDFRPVVIVASTETNLTGVWLFDTLGEAHTETVTILHSGAYLSGHVTGVADNYPLSGTVSSDDSVTFSFHPQGGDPSFTVAFQGTLAAPDNLQGSHVVNGVTGGASNGTRM
jgi:hypothetical protein